MLTAFQSNRRAQSTEHLTTWARYWIVTAFS
jgi:hypothetical protein